MSMVRKAVTGATAGAELLFSRGGKEYQYFTSGMHKGEIEGIRNNLLGRLSDSGDAFGQRMFDRLMQNGTISLKPAMSGAAAAAPAAAPIRGGGSPVSKAVQLVGGGGGGAGGSLVLRRGGGGGGELVLRTPGATPGAITGGAGGAGYLAQAMWGAGSGAVFGAVMGEEGNRGRSALAGAFGGMAGGAAMASYARWGAGSSTQAINKIGSMLGTGRIGQAWRSTGTQVTHKGLQGYHKASNRNAVFASGAMLGGGAFGAMFASNGRSHKRGFNSSRGNSFSR